MGYSLKRLLKTILFQKDTTNLSGTYSEIKKVYPKINSLLIAGFVSSFGTILTNIAFPLQVYEVTRSQVIFADIVLIETIALIISSIFIMGLVDQISPKKALVISNLFDGALLFSLFIIEYLRIDCNGWHYYIFALLSSLTTPIIIPSYIKLVSNLLKGDKPKVENISSLNEMCTSLSIIFGPMLSALIMQAFAPFYVFFLDALTFFYAFIVFAMVKIDYTKLDKIRITIGSTLNDVKRGFGLAIKNPYVCMILIQQSFISFAYILITSNVTFHLRDVLKVSESTYSIVILFNGVGGLIGGYINYASTIKRNYKIFISTVFYALAGTLYSIGYNPLLIALAIFSINLGAVMARVNTRLACYNEGGEDDGGKLLTFRYWTLMTVMLMASLVSVNIIKHFSTYEIFRMALVSIVISLLLSIILVFNKKYSEK